MRILYWSAGEYPNQRHRQATLLLARRAGFDRLADLGAKVDHPSLCHFPAIPANLAQYRLKPGAARGLIAENEADFVQQRQKLVSGRNRTTLIPDAFRPTCLPFPRTTFCLTLSPLPEPWPSGIRPPPLIRQE